MSVDVGHSATEEANHRFLGRKSVLRFAQTVDAPLASTVLSCPHLEKESFPHENTRVDQAGPRGVSDETRP